VDNLLAGEALDERARTAIVRAADGNPLFVEEMLAMLVEDGRTDVGELEIPPTIQALLAARLDRLSVSERVSLERASIEGSSFHRGAVEALLDELDTARCREALRTLMRKELIRPDAATVPADEAYRFRHILIRDAAYREIPKALRSDLHERYARWLERKL